VRIFLLSLCFVFTAYLASAQVEVWRNYYFNAGEKNERQAFYDFAQSHAPQNAVEKAYKGVAIAMYAEVVSGVQKKFEVFDQGKALLEQAIRDDFYNPEIRFLRFSVQSKVPAIVGYDDQLEEDAWRIVGGLKASMMNPREAFWAKAIRLMLQSGELDAALTKELQAYAS
jgi:hypothetical protein